MTGTARSPPPQVAAALVAVCPRLFPLPPLPPGRGLLAVRLAIPPAGAPLKRSMTPLQLAARRRRGGGLRPVRCGHGLDVEARCPRVCLAAIG